MRIMVGMDSMCAIYRVRRTHAQSPEVPGRKKLNYSAAETGKTEAFGRNGFYLCSGHCEHSSEECVYLIRLA